MITKCKKHQNILVVIYDFVVSFLFWIILSFLTLISIKHTCFVDSYEKTFFLKDSPIMHLAIILSFVIICSFLSKRQSIKMICMRLDKDDRLFKAIKSIGLILIFFSSIYFIFSAKLWPVSDQLFVQESVAAISSGDYSSLLKGGYLAVYPNQLGLVWISFCFFKIFGFGNYIAFQIMNAVFLVLFYKALSEITALICPQKRFLELCVILLGIIFYPLQIYCTFVYGTIPGLALSTYSVLYALRYKNAALKKDAIISALFILLAMLFKPNYLICFIGIFLHSVIWLFRENVSDASEGNSKKHCSGKGILLPVLLIIAFLLQSKLPSIITTAATGVSAPKGASSLSWIAMGMQESDLAEGWYNGFNTDTLNEYDFDSELQGAVAKKEIVERLSYFAGNPHYAIEFFTRKLTSEWNDPTYEAYWILRTSGRSDASASWAKSFISYDNFLRGAGFLNIFQSLILAGALLYGAFALFADKTAHSTYSTLSANILLAIIFVGGFFFHLLWEAKSQYTLTYVVLLFPLSLMGYYSFIKKTSTLSKRSLALFLIKLLIPTVLFALVYSGSIGSHMSSDNDAFYRTMERELGE